MVENFLEIKVDKWTFRVPTDRLYNENDCWAKLDGDAATIGITDFMQSMAGDVIYVELPIIGTLIEQFDEAGSFETVKTVLDVLSPVTGTVKEINEELKQKPELINQDPYGKGWFIKIQVKNFEADQGTLDTPQAYFEIMKRKIETERLKLKK